MRNNGRNPTTNILLNSLGEQVSFTNSGTLTFQNITFSAAIHGVPITASSPFNGPPIGFIPYTALSGGMILDIQNYFFSPLSNNTYAIEFNYDLKDMNGRITLSGNVGGTSPRSTHTALSWNVQQSIVGTALSWSSAVGVSSSIVVKEPGDYMVISNMRWGTDLSNSRRVLYVTKNNDLGFDTKFGRGYTTWTLSGGITGRLSTSAIITDCIENDIIQIGTFQDTGIDLSYANARLVDVYRIKSNMVPTGSVSGILIGIG